jgi:3-oxo-4-pregnene-20-carboxyl-CoA dehydrogenase beta subunit
VFIDYTEEQRKLRDELRAYFATLISPAERRAIETDAFGETYMDVCRRLGRDGWLGIGWPQEFGGRGFGPVEQQIFVNEAARAEVPYPLITLQTVGPTLLKYGTKEQKDFFLPKILAGECHFAIGYSEPGAGTDLAALRTSARREQDGAGGDVYVVNGQKIYTSGAHYAGYVWLAVRTDPDAPKHKGISILIADCSDPGFSWTPIITADGKHHTNSTYYSDVKVPVSMLVGEENKGWNLIVSQLNHERLVLGPAGNLGQRYDRLVRWAATSPPAASCPADAGRRPIDEPEVRRAIAQVYAWLRTNELLNWQVAAGMDAGWLGAPDASANKIYGSERLQDSGRLIGELLARYGDPADPQTVEFMERLDTGVKGALVMTFGGGVNEVQRELIAMLGLGLPRAPR